MSLYERLGGSPAITAVVAKFYEIMLKDQRVAHYFTNTNMDKQKQRQIEFITLVTGGPNHYQGTEMKTAHCKHSIGHMEFDATWENLQKALHCFNVPEKEINELKEIFYSVESEIVNKTQKAEENSDKTLYEKLGGQAAVNLLVNKFYEIMLKDPKVSHYFANTDMKKQITSQVEFISMFTGGPAGYKGKDMKAVHCSYKIGHLQFDATWKNLETALKTYLVSESLINEVKEIFYSVESDIVTETTSKTESQVKGKCPFHKVQEHPKEEQKCPVTEIKAQEKPQARSLYDRLGGNGAVHLVVNKFYDFMLEDPKVKSYFSKTDMEKQKASQIEFISMVTGGPNNYQGKDMKAAHCPYKIGHIEFDATWHNLEKAFAYFKVNPSLVNEVKEIFYSVEGDIVNAPESSPQKHPEQKSTKEASANKQNLTFKSEDLVPATSTAKQPLKECPYIPSSEKLEESELMKCPHMQVKLKEIQMYCHKLSQNEKRKLRQEMISKEEHAKEVRKLSNNPYQKTYY